MCETGGPVGEGTINAGNLFLSLSDAVDLASPNIARHQQRTAYIATAIANAAGLPEHEKRTIFIAALLHDTGAITVEEKIALHDFETDAVRKHCVRGELLLRRIPELEREATLVRHHHTEWREWEQPIDLSPVFCSQILLLADYVERLIHRNRYILHQREEIVARVRAVSGTMAHPLVVERFLEAAKAEAFWLDLISPRLFSMLFHQGPLRGSEIDYRRLENVSELFRDLIDFKSPFTATHTSGVSACADMLARLAGLDEDACRELRIAGNLHDLGKLAMPTSILEKRGPLTRAETEIIRSHSYHTYGTIASIAGLERIAELAGYHHERLDGSGYPFQRVASELTIGARILAVADTFTAVTEDRPYRKGMERDRIERIMGEMARGRSLDSDAVALLLAHIGETTDRVEGAQRAARDFYESRIDVA